MAQPGRAGGSERSAAIDETVERYPPPYLLTCDLAVFPVMVDAGAAETWTDTPVVSGLGYTVLLLVAVRYYRAEYGPERTPLHFGPSGTDLYREIVCALPSGLWPRISFAFPRLWLDTPDPVPLELGWRYGFPKTTGAIDFNFNHSGRSVHIAASDEEGAIMVADCGRTLPLPAALFSVLAAGDALFPSTGLRARMRLVDASKASLLRIRRWELPRLERWGLGGRAVFGFWLEGARIALDAPRELRPDNTR